MWLCDVPSTWVKSPPTIILEPSAVTASAVTERVGGRRHEVSEPVDVSNAAGRGAGGAGDRGEVAADVARTRPRLRRISLLPCPDDRSGYTRGPEPVESRAARQRTPEARVRRRGRPSIAGSSARTPTGRPFAGAPPPASPRRTRPPGCTRSPGRGSSGAAD